MQDINRLSYDIAQTLLEGFDRHFKIFYDITAKAKELFEQSKWHEVSNVSKERIYYYDKRVKESVVFLKDKYILDDFDDKLWLEVKQEYVILIANNNRPELAETFFNSVFCKLFDKRFYNNNFIFVKPSVNTNYIDIDNPIIKGFCIEDGNVEDCFEKILLRIGFTTNFIDLKRDIDLLKKEFSKKFTQDVNQTFEIEIIKESFFRNKATYIIGKIISHEQILPLCITILNSKGRGLYVDAILMDFKELSMVFSFSRAYFMLNSKVPSAVVNYLSDILPSKTDADLYSAIGFHKQGKTLLYRLFLKYIKSTDSKLKLAPGIKGMVMLVFTFPVYPYVFKLIRDSFDASKDVNRQTVKDKYQVVKNHDRIGRLADTWEFSNVAIPLDRIDDELLKELKELALSSLTFDGNLLIIKHLYIEQKMQPLNIYLEDANKEEIEHIMHDYGCAIKELINVNIFPGDMLLKNFGVTRQNRVVFYDYDEISSMIEMNFRKIPKPRNIEDEMSAEPWYHVANNDVFPEEFCGFLFYSKEVREAFLKHHTDLLEPEYWQEVQKRLSIDEIRDVFPYSQENRMCNIYNLRRE